MDLSHWKGLLIILVTLAAIAFALYVAFAPAA